VHSPLAAELLACVSGLDIYEHVESLFRFLQHSIEEHVLHIDNYPVISHLSTSENYSVAAPQKGLPAKLFFYVKHAVTTKKVVLSWVAGKDQPADIGTKPCPTLTSLDFVLLVMSGCTPAGVMKKKRYPPPRTQGVAKPAQR
jgi:hypothetical protein